MTEKLAAWLANFEELGAPTVDALAGIGWGLFPAGCRVVWRKRDIRGGERLRLRDRYILKLHRPKDPRGGDGTALLLERLGNWVRFGAPQFGDDQTVTLTDGHLAAQGKEDVARFEATLTVEYTVG